VAEKPSIVLSLRTFMTALILLALLMIAAGVMTAVIPAGTFERTVMDGREVIIPGTFRIIERPDMTFWRYVSAPLLVLSSTAGQTALFIILFLFAVAGSIGLLEKSDVMIYAVDRLVRRVGTHQYTLMALIVLFFMTISAVIGTFEENLFMVPLMVMLACRLHWDSLVGLGMSLLASCFGFAAALTNPFSIAITQRIAGLPLYSGIIYRIVIFAAFYAMLMVFLVRYARRIEKDPEKSLVYHEDQLQRERIAALGLALAGNDPVGTDQGRKMQKALAILAGMLVLVIILIILSALLSALSDIMFALMGLMLLTAGIAASHTAGLTGKIIRQTLRSSMLRVLPIVLLILMVMSIRTIFEQGRIIDTILHFSAELVSGASPYVAAIMVYVLILLLELFIGASSAKALLIMPIIAPLAELVQITRQTAVLAFSFGDGFSNVLYPTNPVLIICLGLTVVTWPKWIRWTLGLQVAAFILACLFLAGAVYFSYGPF
jgi:uncharacterized ion transporter superfamily protein YfcC